MGGFAHGGAGGLHPPQCRHNNTLTAAMLVCLGLGLTRNAVCNDQLCQPPVAIGGEVSGHSNHGGVAIKAAGVSSTCGGGGGGAG